MHQLGSWCVHIGLVMCVIVWLIETLVSNNYRNEFIIWTWAIGLTADHQISNIVSMSINRLISLTKGIINFISLPQQQHFIMLLVWVTKKERKKKSFTSVYTTYTYKMMKKEVKEMFVYEWFFENKLASGKCVVIWIVILLCTPLDIKLFYIMLFLACHLSLFRKDTIVSTEKSPYLVDRGSKTE